MTPFPRTTVGDVSVSRMIAGTNWLLGFSHTSAAKDNFINEYNYNRHSVANVFEVFFRAGVDTVMGQIERDPFYEGIQETQDRTGVKAIVVATPSFPVDHNTPANGLDLGEVERILDIQVARGATFCLPHQGVTDALVDRCTREVRHMAPVCQMIRERGMVPGLSTHMPETIIYADESGLDVETYISIFNSMGFLMQIEVDWVANAIREAKKPVMTIKPMASGQLRPLQGLTFVWNAIRDQDMVTVGTMTPDEARECIDLSLAILERRAPTVRLQETRSKAAVKPRSET